jgi:hypothetical protein
MAAVVTQCGGDVVNLAARRGLAGARPMGCVPVKGRKVPSGIYRIA